MTTLWIQDEIRNGTATASGVVGVEVVATYLDWSYTEGALQPISVQFMASADYLKFQSTGNASYTVPEPVPPREVVVYTTVTNAEEIMAYIQNYVFQVSVEESVFLDATSASINSEVSLPVPGGQLDQATCPFSDSDSDAPTTSTNQTDAPDGNRTVPPGPTPAPVPAGKSRVSIRTKFVISNLEDLEEPSTLALDTAWGLLVEEVVNTTSAGRRGLREGRRQLLVEYENGTASIEEITLLDCPKGTHPDLTCHEAIGVYSILLSEEDRDDPAGQEEKYGTATLDAINEGRLQEILDEEFPASPLIIGTVEDPDPAPDGATRRYIRTKFVISNLEGLVELADVNASEHGLNAAWKPFVAEVVRNTSEARRGLREGHRQLRVEFEEGREHIYDYTEVDCPADTHEELICHDAEGIYSILLYDNDREFPRRTDNKYGTATVAAINAGRLQEILDAQTPNSALYIGTVGKPGSSGGMPLWLLILIILLIILCCCCILVPLIYLFLKNKDRGGEPKLDAYDEEGFAYDFLIPPHQKVQTEVDDEVDDATKDADGEDDEFFEDEAGGVVAAKAVESDDDDAAPATKMEESDDEEEGGEVSDEEGVNVTAEVEDEDDSDNEEEPLVDGDDADGDPEMVELDNEMEGSESFHENAEGMEDWDDDAGEGGEEHSDEEWDDDGEDNEKE